MYSNKTRSLAHASFSSQFNYCLLLWVWHNCQTIKINLLYEKCLFLIYSDKQSSFEDLLEKNNSVSIDYRNLQILAVKMYKVFKGLTSALFKGTLMQI